MFFMYKHISCTSNGDNLVPFIKTGNALNSRMLSQTTINTFRKKKWERGKFWRPHAGRFHDYRNKLFNGKPIL